jgi:hypothetical protein
MECPRPAGEGWVSCSPCWKKSAKIIRDINNQNILALLYLLGSSRPVGFPQVSMQDFDRINLEMDVGETPTLLEVK